MLARIVVALDQESPGSSPGGAIKAVAKCCGFLIAPPVDRLYTYRKQLAILDRGTT
jgi:hypothetical protein